MKKQVARAKNDLFYTVLSESGGDLYEIKSLTKVGRLDHHYTTDLLSVENNMLVVVCLNYEVNQSQNKRFVWFSLDSMDVVPLFTIINLCCHLR